MELTKDVQNLSTTLNDKFYDKVEYLVERWEDEKKYEDSKDYSNALVKYFEQLGYSNVTANWNKGNFTIMVPLNETQTGVVRNKLTRSSMKVSLAIQEKVTK